MSPSVTSSQSLICVGYKDGVVPQVRLHPDRLSRGAPRQDELQEDDEGVRVERPLHRPREGFLQGSRGLGVAATASERTADSRGDRGSHGLTGIVGNDVSGGRLGLHHAGNRLLIRNET